MLNADNFIRIGVAVPVNNIYDVSSNASNICKLIEQAACNHVQILLFPELCLTGATCGDLFFQKALLDKADQCMQIIQNTTKQNPILSIIGTPNEYNGVLYNTAVIIQNGTEITSITEQRLTDEKRRWFYDDYPSRETSNDSNCITVNGLTFQIVFGEKIIGNGCENADIVLHLAAAVDGAGKHCQKLNSIKAFSKESENVYVYVNAGTGESTTDYTFDGYGCICEDGIIEKETEKYSLNHQLIYYDIDVDRITSVKRRKKRITLQNTVSINIEPYTAKKPERNFVKNPFLSYDICKKNTFLNDILTIQMTGLAKRIRRTNAKKIVLSVSGGLDSTLALIVCIQTMKYLKRDIKEIIGISIPGYGTSNKTRGNALKLMELFGIAWREIPLNDACNVHFRDIGHDRSHDITFENAQARERMQIAMDIANMENAFVVGTGDMTELALGFTTYNGDHMSNYSVNCGIPKTVVQEVVRYVASQMMFSEQISNVLIDIIDTPISPELLPPTTKNEISQKTEEIVGKYELNDYFLYYVVKYGYHPDKIVRLAEYTFEEKYKPNEIRNRLQEFYRRFITQQYKRSCLPDGPQIFDFSLSPRGGVVMPSDAAIQL